ncbi:putative membrane protein [Sterolibacterium denitrificans]|uniref:Membrane protein n=2 Tax=Sterolibacterium denitrificans TaxID=157592 RepID=A0A656Z8I5_9PROT|nr:phage holin family protein [Sterolibacterium denitrificans]KYC29323.1 membrane protein [Sterolibacterium denitrificans]SMB30759.1 putative membrane protein [Sterolibacterium denitrificans]
MFDGLTNFLLHWATLAGALWLASHLFRNVRFDSHGALIAAALLLGFANTFVRPLVILLTLPFTLITFGLFLLVVNGLMILLVARLVRGFQVTGLWTAMLVSIFISLFSFAVSYFLADHGAAFQLPIGPAGPGGPGTWI